ncbi:MAG TPA: peptidylprolyl isomerase [Bacteroidia bacterium]|nr:peptidylprolyl isomerase [Bacteroidia bacterium]HNT79046.1 peptidylprolyl isomerase [Bacteroidia bacterium]
MAIIERIRNRAGLLIGIIGFSILAFVMSDLLTSNRPFLSNDTSVAVVGGDKVNIQDFENRVNKLVFNYKLNSGNETVDQSTMDQLREQAWAQLVNDMVMGSEYQKIGLNVSADELFDMVQGQNIHPQVREAFKDPNTGQFNAAQVINFLKNMDSDPTGKSRAQWVLFENGMREERLGAKYNAMLSGGVYVTSIESENYRLANGRKSTINYVHVNYNTINDSGITLTDAELRAAYEANKNKYKQENSSQISYVIYDVLPSANDRLRALESANKAAEDFRNTKNDSLFAVSNSDNPVDLNFKAKGDFAPAIDSIIFSLNTGTVIGPYEESGFYKVSKVIAFKTIPDSVKARHILFKVDNPANDAMAKAAADSIKNLIDNGQPFETFALLSADPGSAQKGGDLGWFQAGMMVQNFNDACFYGKKGDLVIVKTEFGYHIINVTDQSNGKLNAQVYTIDLGIEAGSDTYQEAFARANAFASQYRTAAEFDKAVTEQKLQIKTADFVRETDKTIPGVESAREIVRWSYTGEIGEISKAFEADDKFVVAKLIDRKEKGIAKLEQVKPQVEAEARKQKKFEMISAKMAGGDINTIATSIGTSVQQAGELTFGSGYIQNLGTEPEVAGTVFGMKVGETSKPIKGNTGVFIVQVHNFVEAPVDGGGIDNRSTLLSTFKQRVQYEVSNALREKANIKDNRGKFY